MARLAKLGRVSRSFEIRRLTQADIADYRAIRLVMLQTEPAFFGSTYATEAVRPLADFARALEAAVIFGAYAGAEIVGTIRFMRETGAKEKHKGIIGGVFVRPEYHGMGIGAELMTAAIEAAREVVEQVNLRVVQGNEPAIALYRRFGFTIYGVEPRARKAADGYSDMVLMALRLRPD
jgi:RimJ/RimL family protein N-acetyltransferase